MTANHKALIYGIGVLVSWLLSYYSALTDMVHVWYHSNTYTHGFFILPIVIYLIWLKKDNLEYSLQKSEWGWLFPLILVQSLFIAVSLLGINLFTQLCAYLSLVACITAMFGWRFVFQVIFPIAYLIFAIPFGEEFVPALQDITAQLSVFLLNLINIPVYQEGLYLYIPNGTFEVAEACAGIRFLIASIALGCLYAYVNYQKLWKRCLFILIAFALPIIANGIRAFGIIVIGYYSDMKYATGADHLIYGWFFFAFIILLLFWLGRFGQDPEPVSETKSKQYAVKLNPYLCGLLASILFAPAIYLNYLNHSTPEKTISINQQMPVIFKNINRKSSLSWQPIFKDAQTEWLGEVNSLPIYIAQYFQDSQSHELVSGLHRYFNIDKWSLQQSKNIRLDDATYTQLNLVNVQGQNIRLRYWYQVQTQQSSNTLTTKLAQLKSKLTQQQGAGYFIAVQIPDDYNEANWQALMKSFKQLKIKDETK